MGVPIIYVLNRRTYYINSDDTRRFYAHIDHFITHTFQGVETINEAIQALKSGDCLRAVVTY